MTHDTTPLPSNAKWDAPALGAVGSIAMLVWTLSVMGPIVHGWEHLAPESRYPWGLMCGFLASMLSWLLHPYRSLGLIPLVVLVYLVGMISAEFRPQDTAFPLFTIGFSYGMFVGIGLRYLRNQLRGKEARKVKEITWRDTPIQLVMLAVLAMLAFASPSRPMLRPLYYTLLAFLLLYSWIRLFRPFFELCVEALMNKGYRIRAQGPGASTVPIHGPVIVISNHACWWDPLFLAGVLPRPITPMMTSVYYDKWFLKPLMKYVFQTIRVADVRIRRETPPEIRDAIAALDEGKCIVLFPEGYLRRKEELPLRRFGRGVWEILKERPNTPVVACWIEGAWGSHSSYWNGPPTVNKPKEFRRPITVAMSTPVAVSPEILVDQMKTRIHLMNAVSAARKHVGLPELPPFVIPKGDDETDHPKSGEVPTE